MCIDVAQSKTRGLWHGRRARPWCGQKNSQASTGVATFSTRVAVSFPVRSFGRFFYIPSGMFIAFAQRPQSLWRFHYIKFSMTHSSIMSKHWRRSVTQEVMFVRNLVGVASVVWSWAVADISHTIRGLLSCKQLHRHCIFVRNPSNWFRNGV